MTLKAKNLIKKTSKPVYELFEIVNLSKKIHESYSPVSVPKDCGNFFTFLIIVSI